MSFTKGKSGNPAGRPRAAQNTEEEPFENWVQNRINGYIKENFHYLEELDRPDGMKKARIFCEVLKYAASKPVSRREPEQKFEVMDTAQLSEIVIQLQEKSLPHFTLAHDLGLDRENDARQNIGALIESLEKKV